MEGGGTLLGGGERELQIREGKTLEGGGGRVIREGKTLAGGGGGGDKEVCVCVVA